MSALLLLACVPNTPPPDPHAYAQALISVKAAPEQADTTCGALVDSDLRDDCLLLGTELLAEASPERATKLCEAIETAASRDECFFQLAEASEDPDRCRAAGQFADDCRMHLWSSGLSSLLDDETVPGTLEPKVRAALSLYQFSEDDLRPWSAAYRWALERMHPLDRARCDAAGSPQLVEACRRTGLVVYDDRLNRARDRGMLPCIDPLPDALAHTPDPEITALIASRNDLCPQGGD